MLVVVAFLRCSQTTTCFVFICSVVLEIQGVWIKVNNVKYKINPCQQNVCILYNDCAVNSIGANVVLRWTGGGCWRDHRLCGCSHHSRPHGGSLAPWNMNSRHCVVLHLTSSLLVSALSAACCDAQPGWRSRIHTQCSTASYPHVLYLIFRALIQDLLCDLDFTSSYLWPALMVLCN